MNAKTLMTTALAAMLATALEAAVGVKNVTCQQRYPWNGKVDIDYEVTSDDPNADVWVYPTGYDKDANVSMAPRALTGEGAGAAVKPGKHRMTWDVSADYPDFASTAFSVKMIALTGGAPYMVIDLSGGVDALSYPVSYLSAVPAGGWSDEYKTTKLVLRLIPPGTFMMGSPSDELGRNSNEERHNVTLTEPFYIGVFEVTQKQWQMVLGAWNFNYKGDMRPADNIAYVDVRGNVNGLSWPTHNQVDANSFAGRLRSKANMLFDLPTEAQWEYACRAGVGTSVNSGKNISSTSTCAEMNEVARYSGTRSWNIGGYTDRTTTVGSFLANAWGLYDMHGNAREWCLDGWVENLGTSPVKDPKGAYNDNKVIRSGTWGKNANMCRCAWRGAYHYNTRWDDSDCTGVRIVCLPASR